MEDIMNNIDMEAVDTAMEAVEDIGIDNIPVEAIPEAGLGVGGKVAVGLMVLTTVAAATVGIYRWIKKKVSKPEIVEFEYPTATEREADTVDYEEYVAENSDEE